MSAEKRRSELPTLPRPERGKDEAAVLHAFRLTVWFGRRIYRGYIRFPRILRLIIILWLMVVLMKTCQPPPSAHRPASEAADIGMFHARAPKTLSRQCTT